MKKKLALLMAAIMTVAMVPMTAFASTKLTAVDEIYAGVGEKNVFKSRVELSKNDDQVNVKSTGVAENGLGTFEIYCELENGEFDDAMFTLEDNEMGVAKVEKVSDTKAKVTLITRVFNQEEGAKNKACVLDIVAYALEAGDVVAKFTSNVPNFKAASEVIATASTGKVEIASDGVKTFVEDGASTLKIKDITLNELKENALKNNDITLKLKGDWKFVNNKDQAVSVDNGKDTAQISVTFLNSSARGTVESITDDEIVINISTGANNVKLEDMTISGIVLKTTKSCDPGDVATITVSSKDFDSVKLEVAKMVEEAVTYSVEDDDLPTIWAGKNYDDTDDDSNTLEVSVEENTGDILNTSRKATFTFPEGIEVVALDYDDDDFEDAFTYEIDENVVTIRNYSTAAADEKESEEETDFGMKFLLNAAPTFSGDVTVTLGGEFDDVEFKVATVKAPYTIEAKTSEVLIDYRYVPVNEIVITEAEDGLLEKNAVIVLEVEKMDFEDAGSYEVTEGDIDVDVDIDTADGKAQLKVTVDDDSTEASTIVISGLELYLDRTLPVGGYALTEIKDEAHPTVLWQNSTSNDDEDFESYNYTPDSNTQSNGLFKYKDLTLNDSYVEVVTQARDQDDYTTNRKIVITIGATTMAVGTETVTLDAPAYINAENYTELPLRAVSEAFGATVAWDDASRTVTVMMGQRVVSMTIGSKTMYINGTPVAMNTAPEITADRTFVPVRDLANALGISKIDWNEAAATVTLN